VIKRKVLQSLGYKVYNLDLRAYLSKADPAGKEQVLTFAIRELLKEIKK